MKEFRYLVKVDKSNPKAALEKLGKLIGDDKDLFKGLESDFISKQDYITAVPIEIALTTELRASALYSVPGLRFTVTGVPANRINRLLEFGYTTHISVCVEEEGECDPAEPTTCSGGEEYEHEGDNRKDCETLSPKPEAKFWVNGKEVNESEYLKEVEIFKERLKGFLPRLVELFN